MSLAKIGKIISSLIALLFVAVIDFVVVFCATLGYREFYYSDADVTYLWDVIGEYKICLIILTSALLLLIAARIIINKKNSTDKMSSRGRLAIREAVYGISLLDQNARKEYRRISKRKNIVDLIGSQISALCFVAAVDYLVFFAEFSRNNIVGDVSFAIAIVLIFSALGLAIYIARDFHSERACEKQLELFGKVPVQKKTEKIISELYRSKGFLKFKKKFGRQRVLRALMVGASAGLLLGGILLILSKLALIGPEPIFSLYIGIGVMLIVGGFAFLFGGRSDMAIARELDRKFGLKARVETMVEYNGEESDMLEMQRQDTEQKLAEIPTGAYKFNKLWIYILAIVLSLAIVGVGVVIKNMRDYVPPEEVEPFKLSALQEVGLTELIRYVETSRMEDEFKTPMVEELNSLLDDLKRIDTMPDMQAALTKSMAVLLDITYNSSTATEMLDALWDTGDVHLRYLAKVLDTSTTQSADWGDFAEKLAEYIGILMGDEETDENATVGAARVKWAIDSMMINLDVALRSSGLDESDEMYVAVNNIFTRPIVGLASVKLQMDYLSDEEARGVLTNSFEIMKDDTFSAIDLNRANAAVGEYAMTRLASLFAAPLPEFERPEFVKKNLSVDGSQGSAGDDNDENRPGGGGIGPGATFGSDDLVLNPLTGEYVTYGELIHTYYTIMYERLDSDLYTEEQKQMIIKYFDLLFAGIEDEEGK